MLVTIISAGFFSNIIGKWVESGECNPAHAVKLASAICYDNIRKAVDDI